MFDVAVIGAGPAGCVAATELGAQGARVALIDGSHPREKPCGGGVTARALRLVDSVPFQFQQVPSVTIRSARFAHSGRSVSMGLDDTPGDVRLAVVARRDFDEALLYRAETAGVRLFRSRATNITRAARRWTVRTRNDVLEADWILGADGPNSLVRRRVSVPFARADLSIAAGYYVHGPSSNEIAIEFLDAPAGYLWSFPRADHLAVGACAQADSITPAPLLDIVSRWITRNVNGAAARLERYGWPIPSLSAESLERERPAGDRWMLLGDAAGMVDPITREGIYLAMLSGATAAASLADTASPSRRYIDAVRECVYDELLRAARLKARFFQPRFMGLLVSALDRSARIRAIMTDLIAGEQTYKGLRRRLLTTLEVKLFRELFW